MRLYAHGGIPGIGYAAFLFVVGKIDGELAAATLADAIWEHKREVAQKVAEYQAADEIKKHLQHIIDIYTLGKVYDTHSNVVVMSGRVIERAS